jgi:hypothetical protein
MGALRLWDTCLDLHVECIDCASRACQEWSTYKHIWFCQMQCYDASCYAQVSTSPNSLHTPQILPLFECTKGWEQKLETEQKLIHQRQQVKAIQVSNTSWRHSRAEMIMLGLIIRQISITFPGICQHHRESLWSTLILWGCHKHCNTTTTVHRPS